MAGLGREKTLYYDSSRNNSTVEYSGLPEISSSHQTVYPIPSARRAQENHSNFVLNDEKTAAVARLTLPSQTHLIPPPAYPESCESPKESPRLEPLRPKDPSASYTSEHREENAKRQGFPFWRKKRGIILIIVISNLVIMGVISGGVLIARHVASHSTSSGETAAITGNYTSSTTTSVVSTNLPATTKSASPIIGGPNSDGTQASGNITGSGGASNNSDATGGSEGNSGPRNSPGGGGK